MGIVFGLFEQLIIECMMNIYEQSSKIFVTSSISSAFMKEGKANKAWKKFANIPKKTIFRKLSGCCCLLMFLRIYKKKDKHNNACKNEQIFLRKLYFANLVAAIDF